MTGRKTPRDNPYLGLQAFREGDAEYYFGRDAETRELFAHVKREALTVMFGMSGLGKTSLLQAGLFPLLRESGFLPIQIRLDYAEGKQSPVAQIRERVAEEIERHEIDARPPKAEETLWEYFHRTPFWDPRNRLLTPVLVFDQFEEYFTLGRKAQRRNSLTELGDLIENRIPDAVRKRVAESGVELPEAYDKAKTKIILTLREDYLAHLEGLRRSIPSLSHNRFRLTRMHGECALEAVLKPGESIISMPVAEQVVRFVASALYQGDSLAATQLPLRELEVEPALLSLVCRELNDRRLSREEGEISAGLLAGARGEVLSGFYERSVRGLGEELRRFVEDKLLTPEGYRTTVALQVALDEPGVSADAIGALVDRRLLRREDRLRIPHIELIHDVLAPVIQESRKRRHERERVEGEELRFVQRRRKTRLRVGIGLLAFVVVLLGVTAYRMRIESNKTRKALEEARYQRAEADKARQQAEEESAKARQARAEAEESRNRAEKASRQLVETTAQIFEDRGRNNLLNGKFDEAVEDLMLAYEGVGRVEALRPSLRLLLGRVFRFEEGARGRFRGSIPRPSTIRLSPDGSRVLTLVSDQQARFEISTIDGGSALTKSLGGLRGGRFSPDGARAIFWDRAYASVWNMEGVMLSYIKATDVRDARLSADRSYALCRTDTSVLVWKLSAVVGKPGTSVYRITTGSSGSGGSDGSDGSDGSAAGKGSTIRVAQFSPDSKVVAIGDRGGVLEFWNEQGDRARNPLRLDAAITALAYRPDGRLAVATSRRLIYLSGSPHRLVHPGKSIETLYFTASGKRLVSVAGGTARIWDGASGALVAEHVGSGNRIRSLRVAGERILLLDQRARVIRAETGEETASFELPDGIHGADISADGIVVAVSKRGVTHVWDAKAPRALKPDGRLLSRGFPPFSGRLASLTGHKGRIASLAFSPDGKRVATAGWDRTARIHSIGASDAVQILKGHERQLSRVGFSPDGLKVFTSMLGGNPVRIWDARNGALLKTLGKPGTVGAEAAFLDEGKQILVAGFDRNPNRLFEVESGNLVRSYPMKGHLTGMAVSGNRMRLACVDSDRRCYVWDLASTKPLRIFDTHEKTIDALALNHNGSLVVTASRDSTAVIWEAESGRKLHTLRHGAMVNAVEFNRSGDLLVTASDDGTAKIWGVDGKLRHLLQASGDVSGAAFSPDGTLVATGSGDRTLRIWDVASGRQLALMRGHNDPWVVPRFSPDGAFVATACGDGILRVWPAVQSLRPRAVQGHWGAVKQGLFDAQGRLVTAGEGRFVRVWETQGAEERQVLAISGFVSGNRIVASPDGRRVAIIGSDGGGWLWDTGDRSGATRELGERKLAAVAFAPDSASLLGIDTGLEVHRWNAASGKQQQPVALDTPRHRGGIWFSLLTPDGSQVVTCGQDGTARLWRTSDWTFVRKFGTHSRGLTRASVSADGKLLVTCSDGFDLRLWELATGRQIGGFGSSGDYFSKAAFSRDGRYVLLASNVSWDLIDVRAGKRVADGYVYDTGDIAISPDGRHFAVGYTSSGVNRIVLYSTATGDWVRNFTRGGSAMVHAGKLSSIVFSPDSARLLSASADKTATVWDVATGKAVLDARGHTAEVYDATFSPDGKRFVTGSADKTIRIWNALRKAPPLIRQPGGRVWSASFDPSGKLIAAIVEGKRVVVWKTDSGERIAESKPVDTNLWRLRFSTNGRWVVGLSWDRAVRLFDATTGKLDHAIGYEEALAAGFCADGPRVLTRTNLGGLVYWDARTGKVIEQLQTSGPEVTRARFSPDGRYLLTGRKDGKAILYTAKEGKAVAELAGHTEAITDLRFSPDSRLILTGSEDSTARLWSVADAKAIFTFRGHTGPVNMAVLDPTGVFVATASTDGTVRLWHAGDGKLLDVLKGHPGAVRFVRFRPDGALLASGGDDRTVRLFNVALETRPYSVLKALR